MELIEILKHLEELQERGLGEKPGIEEGEYTSSEDPAFTIAREEFLEVVKKASPQELKQAIVYVRGRFSEIVFNKEFFEVCIEENLN